MGRLHWVVPNIYLKLTYIKLKKVIRLTVMYSMVVENFGLNKNPMDMGSHWVISDINLKLFR